MTPAQLRTRMISALVPACFAGSNVGRVFDCPLCGGAQDLHVAVYDDNKRPNYLFNFACFCGCAPQQVADEMARRARRRRRYRGAGA
jgi:hypothetical protein